MDLLGVIELMFEELIAEDTKQNGTKYMQEGTHPSSMAGHFEFAPSDGIEVGCIDIHECHFVTVTKHRPSFKFELDGQGRAIAFEPIADILPGGSLQIHVVQRV